MCSLSKSTELMYMGIYWFNFKSGCLEVFCKKVFLEISQNSQENAYARLWPATLLKKILWQRCFPVNFAKILSTSFFIEHLWQLVPLIWTMIMIIAFVGWIRNLNLGQHRNPLHSTNRIWKPALNWLWLRIYWMELCNNNLWFSFFREYKKGTLGINGLKETMATFT